MRKKERLKNLLDDELYTQCVKARESEKFVFDKNILFFIEFYEMMITSTDQKYDENIKSPRL